MCHVDLPFGTEQNEVVGKKELYEVEDKQSKKEDSETCGGEFSAETEGDESVCGTDQEQMKKWHLGAGGQQRARGFCSIKLQLRRGLVFVCGQWILTPTQVCLFA